MMDNSKNTFGFESYKQHSAMPPNYKPDIDISDICNDANKSQYWQCIVVMKWSVALGRINIICATVVIYKYRLALHKVHIQKIQHIYSCLNKYNCTYINFSTDMTVYNNYKTIKGNRGNLYSVDTEGLPHSCSPHICNTVLIFRFVDADLMADLTMGRYHTGIIHLLNKTPIE